MGWNELSDGTAAANISLPTVCKRAVSKSRPSPGNITAQQHMTPKPQHPTSPHQTDMTLFLSPSHKGLIFLEEGVGWGSVRAGVFLMSLKPAVCLFTTSCLVPGMSSIRAFGGEGGGN